MTVRRFVRLTSLPEEFVANMFLGGLPMRRDARIAFTDPDSDVSIAVAPSANGRWRLDVHAYDEQGRPLRFSRELGSGSVVDEKQGRARILVGIAPPGTGGDARPGDIIAAVVAFNPHGQSAVEMWPSGFKAGTACNILVQPISSS
jgi:hypothetical protein